MRFTGQLIPKFQPSETRSCEPSSASHPHSADLLGLCDTKRVLFSADGFVGLVTAVGDERVQGGRDVPFTWLWRSAAHRVPSSLPGPRRRPRRRQPPSKSTLCEKALPLHDFQLCARGKLQCQIPCESYRHTCT